MPAERWPEEKIEALRRLVALKQAVVSQIEDRLHAQEIALAGMNLAQQFFPELLRPNPARQAQSRHPGWIRRCPRSRIG